MQNCSLNGKNCMWNPKNQKNFIRVKTFKFLPLFPCESNFSLSLNEDGNQSEIKLHLPRENPKVRPESTWSKWKFPMSSVRSLLDTKELISTVGFLWKFIWQKSDETCKNILPITIRQKSSQFLQFRKHIDILRTRFPAFYIFGTCEKRQWLMICNIPGFDDGFPKIYR